MPQLEHIEAIERHLRQSKLLTQPHDLLLPRPVTGEVTV